MAKNKIRKLRKNRIKELRKKKELTQEQLAQMLGVTQNAIYKLEAGESDLDMEWMEKISEALNVKPYELLPLEWQPQPISEEEQELLALFRKKSTVTDSNDKSHLYKPESIKNSQAS